MVATIESGRVYSRESQMVEFRNHLSLKAPITRANVARLLSIPLLTLLACQTELLATQSDYPTTEYRSFDNPDAFAISRPMQPDSATSSSKQDFRSMSPDSWENSGIGSAGLGAPIANPFGKTKLDSQPGSVPPPSNPQRSQFEAQPNNDFHPGSLQPNSIVTPPRDNQANRFQPASFPNQKHLSPNTQLPSAPTVPADIRLNGPLPAAALNPQNNAIIANPFPELNSNQPMANRSYYPLESSTDSIIRAPLETIPKPPSNPWSYPDSRTSLVAASPGAGPNFRTDLGHRAQPPTERTQIQDDYGQKFSFEQKKTQYPPMREILATGRYFGSASALYLRPAFQGNTAIAHVLSGQTDTFDFDYEVAPQFQVGFESKYGPGIELTYWQYDETSNPSTFTSNGIESGTTSAWMNGANQWSRLTADNVGETLTADHVLDVETLGATFFKEVKLPISRVNGKFGFQYVSITQDMQAILTDGGANPIGSLRARSDMRAYGPQLKLEYFRPIGHTKMEFLASFGTAVLFGKRDQFVVNSTNGNLSRIGADEFLTIFDFFAGAQYRKMTAENRCWFARGGFITQSWLNGGTAILPQDDFGLRGLTFSVGLNR